MLALTLGLSAAILWGISDFVAGVQSRSIPLPLVTTASQGFSLLVLAAIVLVVAPPPPTSSQFAIAALGGVAVAVGITGFYSAMARGSISVAAPIAATGIAIPVAVGLLEGEHPRAVQLAGIAAAAVGVILVSSQTQNGAAADRRTVILSLIAAFGFGWFFVGMDAAAGTGANLLWMLLGARVGAFATLSGVALWVRPPLELPPRSGIVLMGIGLIDLSANGAFLLASSRGLLSLVSVLGSLYSVVTIALALRFLREHVSPAQIAGIVLALGGVAMIAAA